MLNEKKQIIHRKHNANKNVDIKFSLHDTFLE